MEENDIVQIVDEGHHWFPALIVITEIKPWGVMGYTLIVDNTDEPNGRAYIRLKNERIERVGRAVIVTGEEDE
jgi:hypothetical protein